MPKAPVLSREVFYDVLRDGTYRMQDWAVVNTELGKMLEPRPASFINDPNKIAQVDVVDASFTKISQADEDEFYRLHNTSGRLVPLDFTY